MERLELGGPARDGYSNSLGSDDKHRIMLMNHHYVPKHGFLSLGQFRCNTDISICKTGIYLKLKYILA